jgi:AcrR family transcriptional regulator
VPGYVRADVRREQLLGAARAVLVRDGLDRLTLRAVAAQADVHLGTLQYIFRSRTELVQALSERVLADAQYGRFEVGPAGLATELRRQVDWLVRQLLADPAVLELLRHEYVSAVRIAAGEKAPEGQPLFPTDHPGLIAEIGRRSGEVYQRPAADLGQLWGVGLTGLFYDYLACGDLGQFRTGAELLVASVVAIAGPTRA